MDKGASVNITDQNGKTPLHRAAENGHAEIVKDLLEKGANVNATDQNGNIPLGLAADEEIKTLLQSAEESDDASPVLQNDEEESQVPQNAALLEAAKSGDINEVKRLIKEGADVNALDTNLNNSLYWAVKNNHSTTAEVLLDNGADLHTFDPSRERDVLSRYQEIETEHSKNSLHLAAKLGNLEAVQDLLGKGANVNAQNDTGKTPLHWAAREGHKQVVQALLDKGANVNAEDQDGETSLDLATNQDIETLLRNTAKLLKVAKSGDIQEVNSLINKGANVNATDQDGKTPLHWAAVKGHEEVVEALLGKHGIDVNLADKNKDTPLHSVLKKDNIDINVLNALLRAEGINVNTQDGDNRTPLHLAAKKDNIDINVLNALLGAEGIDVNAQDKDNRTPLHWATGRDNVEVVNVLIIKGADVNAQDKDNRTPLHFAAQNNNKEIVDALIKAGADVNIKDEDGKTPLDLTTNEEIKTLLQPAEESDDGSVGEPATDSEGGQEEEEEDSNQSQREQDINGEKGADVQDNDVGPVASTEPAQTEEQPSSFFGSLFSILMKPFSLIGSFFSDFFSWLFGSNTDESTSQTDASVSLLRSDSLDEEDSSGGHYSAMNTDV